MFMRRYATGSGADVIIPIIKRGVVDFAVSADWTPAAGDVRVSLDGGTSANIATLPTAITMGNTAAWKFVFSNAELTCKTLTVTIADAATKGIEDQCFIIETFGHASAQYVSDLAAAQLTANVTHFGGTAGTFSSGRPEVLLAANQDVRNVSGSVPDSSGTTTLLSRLTSGRAGNLDNLDIAISVIQSQITALNNLSAKANWFGSLLLEVPDSGTRTYLFEMVVKDDEDKLTNLDALPTIALVNAAGTDRSSLITTGIANAATGRYTLTITVSTSTVNESLKLTATGTIGAETRYAIIVPQVVDYDNATQIALLLTRIGTPLVSVSADIATRLASVDYTAPNNAGITTAAAQATAAATSAASADGKLTSGRLTRVDALPTATAGTTGGLALHGASGGGSGEQDWTDTERAQIRYRLGLNGTATAPTEPTPDPIVITPSSGDLTTGFLVCVDSAAAVQADVSVYCRLADVPVGGDGFAYSRGLQTAISNEVGVVEFSLVKGASYYIWRGSNRMPEIDPVPIPADAGSTYELPSLVG